MKAFNNDPKLKADLLRIVKEHRVNDQIIQGSYVKWCGSTFHGCAIGCTLNSYVLAQGLSFDSLSTNSPYHDYAKFGIPEDVARAEERIFESLDMNHANRFPEQFIEAIKTGVDLSNCLTNYDLMYPDIDDDPEGARDLFLKTLKAVK